MKSRNKKSMPPHIMIHLDGNEGGGIRTLSDLWKSGFAQRGVRVSYLVNRNGDYTKKLKSEGCEVYCAKMGSLQSKSWYLAGMRMPDAIGWIRSFKSITNARSQFENILRKLRPDVVLGNGASSTAVIGPACKKNSISLVSCFHGVSHPNDFLALRKRGIAFLLNRYCREVVGVSKETIKGFKPFLQIPSRVIYNSVSEVVISPIKRQDFRKRYNIHEESIVFGSASRITLSKAIHIFVNACEAFIKKHPDIPAAFLIAGEPRTESDQIYLRNVLAMIRQKHLQDKIRYVGHQPIADLYSAIDVFCHTHIGFEPLGLTVVEALSAGLPTIACNNGGFLEFLSDEIGVRYDGASPQDLAEGMRKMLDISFRRDQSLKGKSFFLNDYISHPQWIDAWLEILTAK